VIIEEQIEALEETLKRDECPKESVGLWNVQQRIKTMQDAQEGLLLEKTAEGIFRVSFTMQKKYMTNPD
jgi:sensor histidine kinase YesM